MTILSSSLLTDFNAGNWEYVGADASPWAASGSDLAISGTGFYRYKGFPEHMLNKWSLKLVLGSNPAPTGRLGLGIYDRQDEGTPYIRHPHVYIDCSGATKKLIFFIEIWTKFSIDIPATFNFTGAELRVDFKDDLITAVLVDNVNHIVLQRQWRFQCKQWNDDGTNFYDLTGVQGHQTMPSGFFSIAADTGSNFVVHSLDIISNVNPNADILFTGHSWVAGRQSYPLTLRFSDRLQEKYYQANNRKVIENFSSGGLKTPRLAATVDSIRQIFSVRTNPTPLTVMIFIGANDDTSDLSTWIPGLVAVIDQLTASGFNVGCMNYLYYPGDPNAATVADYFVNTLPGLVADPAKFRVYDSFRNDFVVYPGTPKAGIKNGHDNVHLSIVGNDNTATGLYTWFGTNPWVPTTDADADTFIAAVTGGGDTLTTTMRSAVNQLVVDMKAAGIWNKMEIIYPMVGGTSTSHKWNLKNPIDSDAGRRIIWYGSPTHALSGVTFGATGICGDMRHPHQGPGKYDDSAHMSYYGRTNGLSGGFDMGAEYAGTGMWLSTAPSGIYKALSNPYSTIASPYTTGLGLTIHSRVDNTAIHYYQNGVSLGTAPTIPSGGSMPWTLTIGALSSGTPSAAGFPSTKECAFASVGSGLTDAESLALYNAVQTFNTTLGRQV